MEPGATTVADLVESAAGRFPQAVAAAAGDGSLSYAELDGAANRVAHHLRACGVGPEVLVGICLDRSVALAVALMAVLKAGGACVPLDPAYPPERLGLLAADAEVAIVLTRSDLADRLPDTGAPLLRMDTDGHLWAGCPSSPPPRSMDADGAAYVIYTSGSTGPPKGVVLTHRGLVNHHRAVVDLYGLAEGDRVLQFCSLGFDASVEEMFPTWAAGASVVFRPDDEPLFGPGWSAWLRAQRVTVLNLPTAYWQAWTADLEGRGERIPDDVRLVVVGGEKATGPAYRRWRRVGGGRSRWVNAYGPTEATCMSTYHEPGPDDHDAGDGGDPPIGRPLPNTSVIVVDDELKPVAGGGTGELLIGGAGLARGYLHRPDVTAERFVQVGDGGAGPVRMYRTGDRGRRRADGELEYVGRIDGQVKIHGFRVEPGEVEAALARHPAVAGTVVVAHHSPPREKELVAYVAGRGEVALVAADLRRFLAGRLPAHLVPASFVVLDALPLTVNGKVDRDALPPPGLRWDPGPSPSPSRRSSPAEDRLAAIWARVLGVDVAQLGPDDDFFELGGHSLLATQVIAHVREEFGTATPLRAVFEAPTLAGLAAVVAGERGGPGDAVPLTARARRPGARVPLSLAQEQMWALETSADPPGLYNFTALHRFERPVDERALREAVAYLVGRHETLRTGFAADADGRHQCVASGAAVDVAVCALPPAPLADQRRELDRRIAEQELRPFDLGHPPLFRVGLFRLDRGASCLAVTFDHLVADGTGATIFVRELLEVYEATLGGRPPSLPPVDIQFADFALWQREHVSEEALGRQLDWWEHALHGMPLGPTVPFDRAPAEPTRRIASAEVGVPPGTRRALQAVARATGSTLFTVAVAAVQALLGLSAGSTDVAVSTTLSGRSRAELEGMLGMFSGISRIRVDLSGDPSFATLVGRVHEGVLGMFENSDIPFLRVRRRVLPDFPRTPLEVAAALPVEFQYFHTGQDVEVFFRGQLHPMSVTVLDDGGELSGQFSYKLDFFRPETVQRLADDLGRLLEAVGREPSLPLSRLPVTSRPQRWP